MESFCLGNYAEDDAEPVNTLIVVELDPELLIEAALLYHVRLQRVFKVDCWQHLSQPKLMDIYINFQLLITFASIQR